MTDDAKVQADADLIREAQAKGTGATIGAYVKLSCPGWLQSAITLGGGSLAGSLYLGIIGGYEMMWLQPLMMVFGVIMLSAIAYVALSTGEKPFQAINRHVNPVLGWGWAVATLMANLVWAMPQFSLGTAALKQNLGIISNDYVAAFLLFIIAGVVVWFYDSGGKGIKIFEILLKIMVGIVVLSFFLVVGAMTVSDAGLPWGKILGGFIPNPGLIWNPAESLREFIAGSSAPGYWSDTIVSAQRDRMVAAAATAVGINMTFLLPYSMLRKGWTKEFRGLASFDLSTGLFIPFLLATSCVVIAASTQFHGNPEPGLIDAHTTAPAEGSAAAKQLGAYEGNLAKMLTAEKGEAFTSLSDADKKKMMAALPEADRVIAATLIKRDAFALANSLEHLAGPTIAQVVFGIGVVGMAISTIIILMLINGFTLCEMAGKPMTGTWHRIGCFLPGLTGAFGALFLWKQAAFYLAVPTSRFGMVLLPVAYITFFFLMNSRAVLGDALPKGGSRIRWNVLMIVAILLAFGGAAISILNDTAKIPETSPFLAGTRVRDIGIGVFGAFFLAAIVVHFVKPRKSVA